MEDLRHIDWSKSINRSGTPGCYLKTVIDSNYYKLSSFDTAKGFFGHEAFNEVIVSRLGEILGINVLRQALKEVRVNIMGQEYTTYACKSANYLRAKEIKIPFENFYVSRRKQGEDVVSFYKRVGLANWFNTLYVLDYLTMNRDRHGANIEVLCIGKKMRMAPYFDNGLSFLCTITKDLPGYKDRVINVDPFQDMPVNNYVGQRSLFANLGYMTKPVILHQLKLEHKSKIFYGMNKELKSEHIEKIWQIITYRYTFLRNRRLVIND